MSSAMRNYMTEKLSDTKKATVHEAIGRGDADTLRAMIVDGLDVNHPDFPLPLLYLAATESTLDVARILVESGIDKEKTEISGRTALFPAMVDGKVNVVKYLMEVGVPWHIRDRLGFTSLTHMLCRYDCDNRHALVLSVFAKNGGDVLQPARLGGRDGNVLPLTFLSRRSKDTESFRLLKTLTITEYALRRAVLFPPVHPDRGPLHKFGKVMRNLFIPAKTVDDRPHENALADLTEEQQAKMIPIRQQIMPAIIDFFQNWERNKFSEERRAAIFRQAIPNLLREVGIRFEDRNDDLRIVGEAMNLVSPDRARA